MAAKDLSKFLAADSSVACDECKEWITISPWAARHLSTIVVPGNSLCALILQAHVASGHKIGTVEDAAAHGCEIVR